MRNPRIKGFIIKGEVFEDIWGKKPIGTIRGNKAYDPNQNPLGKVAYYQTPGKNKNI
jgi:hypothetical protein